MLKQQLDMMQQQMIQLYQQVQMVAQQQQQQQQQQYLGGGAPVSNANMNNQYPAATAAGGGGGGGGNDCLKTMYCVCNCGQRIYYYTDPKLGLPNSDFENCCYVLQCGPCCPCCCKPCCLGHAYNVQQAPSRVCCLSCGNYR
jgi:hypothetical protein